MIVNGINDAVEITNVPLPVSAGTLDVNVLNSDFDVSVLNTVGISGSVAIDGVPTVALQDNTVIVGNTVPVSGAVSVTGSVDVDNTVTVDGTVDVGNTVTVTGEVDVNQTKTIAVSGSVDIGNTPTVNVGNTVNVAQTKTVGVSGDVGLTAGNTISLVTTAGQEIHSHPAADGDLHIGTSVIQSIITSEGNFSTANLSAGESFIGTAESMLGASTIQFFVSSNVATKITVQQGVEPSFSSDLVEDSWNVLPNIPFASFVSSVSPYSRLKVTNTDTVASSAFVCVMGLTPILSILPRALSDEGRLKTETTITGNQNNDRHSFVSTLGSLNVNTNVRLVGHIFDGTVKDTNFWTEYVSGSGSVVQGGGEIELETGTTADSYASYYTVQRARYSVARPLKMIGYYALDSVPVSGNVRRVGAYDLDDGFFFQIDGFTFAVGTRHGGVDTLITNGNLNGNYGLTWNPSVDVYYKLEIEYGAHGVTWYVDDKLIHKLPSGHWTNTLTLPAYLENYNYGGQTVNSKMDCLGLSIIGMGEFTTNPAYKYITGAGTTVLKIGAGILHRIQNTNNSGSVIIYDNTAGTGDIIANIDLSKIIGTLDFNAPYSNGLTAVVSGPAAQFTVIYE